MSIDEQLLSRVEALRIPLEDPTSPPDWKDWYHFLFLDRRSGTRILINFNIMGRPGQGEIQVSLIVHRPKQQTEPSPSAASPLDTFGTAFALDWQPRMVRRDPLRLQGQGIGLTVQGKTSLVMVQDPRTQLAIRCQGEAMTAPLIVTERSPFGSGYIGWGLVPGLRPKGVLLVGGQSVPIQSDWFCYHDRNFGRFRWGEDIGWEWFVAHLICDDGRTVTVVLDRRTNKDHSLEGLSYIFVYLGQTLVKTFLGPSLQIDWEWSATAVRPLRLPGSMASLFVDRALRCPQALTVNAVDQADHITLQIHFEAMTELVVPDNQTRQYTFIDEVTGHGEVSLFLQGEMLRAQGLTYAEYVQ